MPGAIILNNDSKVPVIKPADLRSALPAIAVGVFAGLGGFLFGYDTGVISGLMEMDKFNEHFGRYYDNVPTNTITADNPARPGYSLSTGERSLCVSILSLGTFLGALSAGSIGDWKGRKPALFIALIVFAIGPLLQCVATNLHVFDLGRFFAGLGVGLISCLVPLYQSETAPRYIRGAVVGCYQWAITIGLLVAACVNEATKDRGNNSSYLIPIALQFPWTAILLFGLFFIPESPRYRIKQGRPQDAIKVIAFLNSRPIDDPLVLADAKEIQDNYETEMAAAGGGWKELLDRGERKSLQRVTTGAVLQALQQLTGINFIFYYGTTFFKSTGAKNPFIFSVITGLVNVASTPACFFFAERFGRRITLIGGALWMFAAQLLVAIIGTTSTISNHAAQKACVAFVCIYIAGFASTWGPMTWIYTGETFSLNIRSRSLAISTASQWLWNFGIGYSTPYLVDEGKGKAGLGPKVFFVWSAFCGLCIVYSYFFVYETKGLGLEEVDNLFLTSTAPTSAARNRQMKAARYQDTEGGVGGEIQHTHEATIANDHSDVDIKSPEGKE